jgi:DNA mismatch endonuclease (patch repair protein)
MSRIRGRDTKPELEVRKQLHRLGYRYRLHVSTLPGTPDLAFPSRKKAIFMHGCYWHGHTCKYGLAQSKTNKAFWRTKIRENQARDARAARLLRRLGWKVLIIWECEVKRASWRPRTIRFLGYTTNCAIAVSRTAGPPLVRTAPAYDTLRPGTGSATARSADVSSRKYTHVASRLR